MVEKMSNFILDNILYKNEKIEGDQKDIMLFGITRIIEDLPKYVAIFFICLFMNILKEAAIVLLISILYKSFVGGAHARTNIGCFISSTIFFITPVIIAKYVNIPTNIVYIIGSVIFLFSIYIIVKKAPADTEEVPILNKSKRKLLRIMAFISLITIFIFSAFFINNIVIFKIILISILFINIFTTKPIYRFFKCKYSFESEEFKENFQN